MANHDPLLILSIITGAFSATPLSNLSEASSQLSAMQFLALGKEKIKALKSEIQRCRMQESVGEVDLNRSKKRVSFQIAELITELVQVVSLSANLLSAWQAMYRCSKSHERPLVYNCWLDLFDFLVVHKTTTW